MKKWILTAIVIGTLSAAMSFSSYAAQWKSDATGWWWEEDDGSYPVSDWREINGKWYYFGGDGYMLANTTTPDGCFVGADGAWVTDGSGEVPAAPYADKLNQYNEDRESISCELAFRKEDLRDHGTYYELNNKEYGIWYWYEGGDGYMEVDTIHKGPVYFYKDAKMSQPEISFENALNDASIPKGNFDGDDRYYWTLFNPDEKGYFTSFYPGYTN